MSLNSESSQLPIHRAASATGDEEEDTSGYLSDTANNTSSSPELLANSNPPPRMSRPAIRLLEGQPERIGDFTEFQYAKYDRDQSNAVEFVDGNANEHRMRQYYQPNGQAGIGRNGNLVIPPGYHHQVARSVKSRSTFAGDETDLGHETDFSIPM